MVAPVADTARRSALRTLLAGLLLGLTAWFVLLLCLHGYFPFLATSAPSFAAGGAIVAMLGGAVSVVAIAVHGDRSARNTLLAGSILAASISCMLFIAMSGIAAPAHLGYDLPYVLAGMLGGAGLFGLGLRMQRHAPGRAGRMFGAAAVAMTLPALAVVSFAAILPFTEWEVASSTPGALALQPVTVVFLSEFVVVLVLTRAGMAVDRQAAARTADENARLRQLTESTFEGLVVHRAGVILDANSAFCAMVGWTLEEVTGQLLGRFLPDAPEAVATTVGQASERDLHTRAGAMPPVEILSRRIVLGDGPALVTAVRDISERRAAERSARDRAQVERLQREAGELRERERLAAESNRAKSVFLAMMSHEIRTPMNAVLGLATSLLDDPLSDEQRCVVKEIQTSGDALLRILNDILDYTRLDASRLDFEFAVFSPATLTHGAASAHNVAALAKGIALTVDLAADLPSAVRGDAGRIRQVLLNLVSNAVKFTETGGVTLSLRRLSEADGRVTLEWEVTDTGIGIAPEQLSSVFDAFVQADSSITRRYGGSGLGLAICGRIVEQMGGTISADSVAGRGSTFRLRMPLEIAAGGMPGEEAREDAAEALQARIRERGVPLRLLLAEDNATNQFVVIRLLKPFDIIVDIAATGAEAVRRAAVNAYDIICMDMRMPVMDGLEATRIIRGTDGPNQAAPIIALTANAFADDIAACLAAGMNRFVAKPVRRETLLTGLVAALPASAMAVPADPATTAGSSLTAFPADARADDAAPEGLCELERELGEVAATRLLRIFMADAQLQLTRMADPGQLPASFVAEAHSLKGAALTVGATSVAAAAAALEREARRTGTRVEDLAGVTRAMADFCRLVDVRVRKLGPVG